jgi:hypothetical protein
MHLRLPRPPLLLALAALAGACTHVPRASMEDDARAKSFETRPEYGGLYVYREGPDGAALELELTLDGRPLGRTSGGDYLFTWVQPGPHTLASRADQDLQLSFEAAAGALVFVRQEGVMGYWTMASKLVRVGEEEGRRAVLGCVRAASGF